MPDVAIAPYREKLNESANQLAERFKAGEDAAQLVQDRARLVDQLLIRAWAHFLQDEADNAALVAVGGYGRGELLPHSDIDLLILYRDNELDQLRGSLEPFLTFLWDIGLEIGHSVRSPQECADVSRDDITIITNMVEARPLTGSRALFDDMQAAIATDRVWPVEAFFKAKMEEQQARHGRFDETAYKLEPNTKESPGGLRDIHTIVWVAKRHYGSDSIYNLVQHGFLTDKEYADLSRGQNFLWQVRFALHLLTDRCEDRLLFDLQIRVAELLGYTDQTNNLAVEQFMQRYYRNIKALMALNDILLQIFAEVILHAGEDVTPTPLNQRFQARHGFVEVRHDDVFRNTPGALLEIFYIMQTRPRLSGIRARTLRLMRRDRHLINHDFRQNIANRRMFMEILRQRGGITHALRRMNRYGILGRYLPNFGKIIGRMQYDLFHTLTVDEHTLFVVRNMRRLALARFDHELPFASRIMQQIEQPELLYVAGLFHDIAKGRGGDHSVLGAEDAAVFCARHGLSSDDSDLVCWLVREHLVMSMTAQRRDISDPAVIHEFATRMGSRKRLDHLTVLTICDIRATNPELWNSWRETLLVTLYQHTARSLERGLEKPLDGEELVEESRSAAAALLTRSKINTPHFKAAWSRLEPEYFLRHSPEEIAWHTRLLVEHMRRTTDDTPLVRVDDVARAGTSVFIYTRDRDYLFGLTTGVLAQLGVTIMDARVNTTTDGYTVDSYMITELDGSPVTDPRRRAEIESALLKTISDPEVSRVEITRRPSRRSRAFKVPTQVTFREDHDGVRTIMEVVTGDRPGLLSLIGEIFRHYNILVETAKIATIGERAEDVFYITNADNQPLRDEAVKDRLRRLTVRALDRLQN